MTVVQAVVLAVVQALTEFLPVSSSAHLILVPKVFGWPDQGLTFDLIMHLGSLTAVVAYFRADLWAMLRGWTGSVTRRPSHDVAAARLAWLVILATLPAVLAGLAFGDLVETQARNPKLIAVTLAVFGLLLFAADRLGRRLRGVDAVGWRAALLIGIAQACALVPGVSRSGATMTAGMALGFTREAAARFSFLLSVPVITAGSLLHGVEVALHGGNGVGLLPLLSGFVVAAACAYLCIAFFMRYILRHSLTVFVVYRLLLSATIVYLLA
ncbi:MAG: undecaprenyl-diphosphate phosphatase [Nitrospirota bacterium]|nr:undecaprenyl-diphosphate phosphatase [Nitrospirota bacterium]